MCYDILPAMILSSTLYQMFVSEIGLCCAGSFGCWAFLGIRMMIASPISSGIDLLSQMCFMRWWVISIVALPPAYSASAHISSGPGALSFANPCMVILISSMVGGSEEVSVVCCNVGGLSSVYICCQKSTNCYSSSSFSLVVGFPFLLSCSLIFFIIFHQSGVFAMICSIYLKSLLFFSALLVLLLSSLPKLSSLSFATFVLWPLEASTLYCQWATRCSCFSLIRSMFLVLSRGNLVVFRSDRCIACL